MENAWNEMKFFDTSSCILDAVYKPPFLVSFNLNFGGKSCQTTRRLANAQTAAQKRPPLRFATSINALIVASITVIGVAGALQLPSCYSSNFKRSARPMSRETGCTTKRGVSVHEKVTTFSWPRQMWTPIDTGSCRPN